MTKIITCGFNCENCTAKGLCGCTCGNNNICLGIPNPKLNFWTCLYCTQTNLALTPKCVNCGSPRKVGI